MARHVFITGGSRGIGRATAEAFLKEGDNVTIMSPNTVVDACRELRKNHLGKIIGVGGDVSKPQDVEFCVDWAMRNNGRIDVLVNCAGIFEKANCTISEWDKMISTNLTGCFRMCRMAIGDMIVGGGKIINVASIAGLSYSKLGSAAYTVSKAGVIALTKHLAAQFGSCPININCVCPGPTDTDMFRSSITDGSYQGVINNIPMKRIADPMEQANVIVFLASEKASYINGAIINVSGGQQ